VNNLSYISNKSVRHLDSDDRAVSRLRLPDSSRGSLRWVLDASEYQGTCILILLKKCDLLPPCFSGCNQGILQS
jgi:hypothetical protein